ncbi:hypothetical protein LV457_03035 [Mycobacterium sp. MYCO198283]|nr:hypothetical protein [Mycobacterium sp. MYCO198283]MCG5431264.1 hypothetical protein [Mycobacterium sp. MYCO198283]
MTRDQETIDRELRLLATVRAACREQGGRPTTAAIDALLDERSRADLDG